jgi:hypothetical protein
MSLYDIAWVVTLIVGFIALLPFVAALVIIVKAIVQWFRNSRRLTIKDLLVLTAIVATSTWVVLLFRE